MARSDTLSRESTGPNCLPAQAHHVTGGQAEENPGTKAGERKKTRKKEKSRRKRGEKKFMKYPRKRGNEHVDDAVRPLRARRE